MAGGCRPARRWMLGSTTAEDLGPARAQGPRDFPGERGQPGVRSVVATRMGHTAVAVMSAMTGGSPIPNAMIATAPRRAETPCGEQLHRPGGPI